MFFKKEQKNTFLGNVRSEHNSRGDANIPQTSNPLWVTPAVSWPKSPKYVCFLCCCVVVFPLTEKELR